LAGIVIPTEILLVCKKVFETCNFVGWVLINAETGQVESSQDHMFDKLIHQELGYKPKSQRLSLCEFCWSSGGWQ
jgi:hypothetical protein